MTAASDEKNHIAPGSWPDAMIDDLKALLAEGQSFGRIAKILSTRYRPITRSAAIGKATRLKLSGCSSKGSAPRKAKARVAPASRQQCAQNARRNFSYQKKQSLADILEKAPVDMAAEAEPIPLHERHAILRRNAQGDIEADPLLTDKSCRWPIGDPRSHDFHFCCREKVVGTPYCGTHTRRAFTLAPPPRSRSNRKTREYAA